MHSKVIVAALVVGLGLGFNGVKNNAKMVAQPVVENDVCDTCEHVEHAQRTLQPKKVAASQSVRPDLFITRARTNSVSSGGSNWYTFTAPFDGKFWFESSDNGSMDPIAQIYLGLGTNYGTVPINEGNRDDANGRNFRFALELDCAETVYIQVRDYYNNSGSYKIKASHNHVFDDRTGYYSNTAHREFCRCGYNRLVNLEIDDQFSGHGRNMVHCSICDKWIDLIPAEHSHSYSRYACYDNGLHWRICDCGSAYLTAHTFDAVYTIGNYQVKHCSGCNAWVEVSAPHTHSYTYSHEYYNEARHKNVCSCGSYQTQEHTFDSYSPYGHGHNDMIHCSVCNANIELGVVSLSNSVSGSIASNDAKWLMFQPQSAGSYSISLAGSYNMYMEFYFGNYPTSMYSSFTTENIGRVTYSRSYSAGEIAFIRVRSANWSAVNFTVSAAQSHTHNYNQLVNYGHTQNHKLVCSCGAYTTQAHTFNTIETYTNTCHKLVCACGYYKLEQHTYDSFSPYGHGHNDMIHCSVCNATIEVTPMDLNTEYYNELDYDDGDWYFFEPSANGTYIFESLGTTDTYGQLYIGDYPAGTPLPNDDGGEGDNFRITASLVAGQRAFLKVTGDPDPYRVRVTRA